ncbi:unnamed protein product [Owenia fusiformis]|uniref:Uncharacterized protein n=1 Tax=Owenia fusiformis TaxID=6347 RepID=A0A8J1UZ09_OWEFU|nr:unnamed protein product [Owenia fusiformis]
MASRKKRNVHNLPESRRDEDEDDILVFGYACKIYRDDERALYIEKGHHLIPWMGDEKFRIDRYDGRGYLHDLREHDAEGNWGGKDYPLSGEEARIEALCDEERYHDLHSSSFDRDAYEEEEIKRLNYAINQEGGYKEVGFSYDNNQYDPSQPTDEQNTAPRPPVEYEEPFEAIAELQIPSGMELPTTVKTNAIIEKTAKFVASQGNQMEIVIKAKQANNEQFNFMNYDHYLYPYYKHLCKMIKSGKYKPDEVRKRKKSGEDEEDGLSHSGYLHPSLAPKSAVPPETPVTSILNALPPGQIHGTAYAKLLGNIKKTQESGRNSPNTKSIPQKERIPKEPHIPKQEQYPTQDSSYPPLDGSYPPQDGAYPPEYNYSQGDYYDQGYHDAYRYGPSVEGPQGAYPGMPPIPGMEPVILPTNNQPPPPGTVPEKPVKEKKKTVPKIQPPPPDLQPIIDRMANYVAKNGDEFEFTVRNKRDRDKRFGFLDDDNEHHPYYLNKKHIFIEEMRKEAEKDGDTDESTDKMSLSAKGVSFSIKTKEPETVELKQKSAFKDDSSDDEERKRREKDQPHSEEEDTSANDAQSNDEEENGLHGARVVDKTQSSDTERRQAEEKLKDKLAAAAREKLAREKQDGGGQKEKQLQSERKRKAAMFLQMLKGGATEDTKEEGSSLPSSTPIGSRSNSPSLKSEMLKKIYKEKSPVLLKTSKRISRSRSRTPKKRRKRSKTPPSSYSIVRRSRSKSPLRHNKVRSRSRSKMRSRSRSKMRSRSRSRDRIKKSSRRKTRSRSRDRKSKKSKRSRSRDRKSRSKRSRSRSRSRKKKSRKRSRSKDHKRKKANSDESDVDSPVLVPDSDDDVIEVKELRLQPSAEPKADKSDSSDTGATGRSVDTALLSKVRAMLKASRQTILKEESNS